MTDLQRLVDALATDYLHGRWQPEPTEEHRVRTLSANANTNASANASARAVSGMSRLGEGGIITAAEIAQFLRPGPAERGVDQWRIAEVLRAYPHGDPLAQALVRHLVHAIAADQHPGRAPHADRYTEAPAEPPADSPTVFTAGGITGARNWQLSATLQLLASSPAHVINPRRAHFEVGDPRAAVAQIAWEHSALAAADVILFWFPAGAVQPIALYELGAHAARGAAIAVGTDPAYERRLDVVEQLRHARPELTVHDSLPATVRAATALLPATPETDS
ncbi:nucleoside 2-deoxyribosyltransferase domain-containing protein [Streptomyces sp. G45]|uniref:nucleoside 2-deoxyribosyltransferase domain-containing protein n=1 Tax=Streptomyces sp. G45 TaxID=3406627 RepID=UPI003C23FFCE